MAAAGAALFFAVASVSSFYAGIGLAAEHRLANAGTNTGIVENRKSLQAEQKRLEGRLEVIGHLGTRSGCRHARSKRISRRVQDPTNETDTGTK